MKKIHRPALALALLLTLAAGQAVAQREGYVVVRGCVIDIENRPVGRARVTLEGLNYRGGIEYTNDEGVTWTDLDGQFEILMKKGDPEQPPLRARITVWSAVGGSTSRERGGTVDREVANNGKPVDLGKPCLMVAPQYFIAVHLEGKNGQARPDTYSRQGAFYSVRLQLRVPSLNETYDGTVFSPGRFEFQPVYPQGTAFEILVLRQPDDEECTPIGGSGGTTGGVGEPYPWRHMLVRFRCVPRKNLIVEALAACAVSDGNCRNGCLGVGALSAYNILRGRKGDSSQMDACNAKCNSANRDCEVQAKALNPELTPPPMAGGPVGGPVGGPSGGPVPPSGSSNCKPDDALLRKYMEQAAAFQRETKFGNPPTMESVRKQWYEELKQHASSSVSRLEELVKMRTLERDKYNWQNSPLARQRMIAQHGLVQLHQWECLLQEAKVREAGGGTAGTPTPGPQAGGVRKDCREVMNDFIDPVNKGSPFKEGGYEKRGYNYNQSVEQSVWAMQQFVRIANRHPACANDAASKQAMQQKLREEQGRCRAGSCVNGRNYGVNEAALEAAIQQSINDWNAGGSTSGTGTGPQTGGGSGLPFAECQRRENASDIGTKLNRIPASDTVQKTRGIIAASDFMISTYSQCLPDRRAQDVVNQYKTTRASSLRTCQQISSNPAICERSPF